MYTAIYTADFETTTYEGIQRTDVWAWSITDIMTFNQWTGNHISTFLDFFNQHRGKVLVYFHNLKFDGTFLISYLHQIGYTQALKYENGQITGFSKDMLMTNKQYKYLISAMGLWYSIKIKVNRLLTITIFDSYKLIPFAIASIPKMFGLPEAKGKIDYTKFRTPGQELTEEENEYVKGDSLIAAKALRIMLDAGHDKLTIGSCCMKEYRDSVNHNRLTVNGKELLTKFNYSEFFPNLYEIGISNALYGSDTVGSYVRKSYRGAWTYLVPEKAGKILHNGITADVNSLYPSMMESESGNIYPVGKPYFRKGKPAQDLIDSKAHFVFLRIKTRFKLKKGYLPFIQIKNSFLYKANEHLVTSDWRDIDGNYHDKIPTEDGGYETVKPIITMTETDYKLFTEHYDLIEPEYLDYCVFQAVSGIFDAYIHKYKEQKINAKTKGDRTIAKLYSNNLYGKLATSTDSSFKIINFNEKGEIIYSTIDEQKKLPGYIPCGSAITSYARNFTIRAAQKNFHGDKPGFAYADTDSLHLDTTSESDVVGIKIHDTQYGCFKIESHWDEAIFARQKTYIEHVTMEDGEEVNPYYLIKCAGMGKDSKDLLAKNLEGKTEKNLKEHVPQSYKDFMSKPLTLLDFKPGLKVPGTLKPRRIPGGTVLVNEIYEMRGLKQFDVRRLLQRERSTE